MPEKAPRTVRYFLRLSEGVTIHGKLKPYYNGLNVFRVEPNYYIQTGDPTNSGTGGLGFFDFKEYNTDPSDVTEGMVAMAQLGKFTSKSQFYIAVGKMEKILGRNNTVFGTVVTGLDVAKKISLSQTNEAGQPLIPVTVNEIKVRRIYK
jgi:cyclophilin family peptidyl-prolyl cis-trans isomerase